MDPDTVPGTRAGSENTLDRTTPVLDATATQGDAPANTSAPDPDAGVLQESRLHRALGTPVRVQMLRLLVERSRTVSEVAAALGVSRPSASRHLVMLADAGLVKRARYGVFVHSRATEEGVARLGTCPPNGFVRAVTSPPPTAEERLRTENPKTVELYLLLGGSLFPYAASTEAEWNRNMIHMIGPKVTPYLPTLYAATLRIRRREPLDGLALPDAVLAAGPAPFQVR